MGEQIRSIVMSEPCPVCGGRMEHDQQRMFTYKGDVTDWYYVGSPHCIRGCVTDPDDRSPGSGPPPTA